MTLGRFSTISTVLNSRLGQLVRQLLRVDRNAVKAALSEFLAKKALSADQIRFIDTIMDNLMVNGSMDPVELVEHPFIDRHSESIIGVMPELAEEVVAIIERVARNAAASQ